MDCRGFDLVELADHISNIINITLLFYFIYKGFIQAAELVCEFL
jgi:hypothetical protein